MKIAVIGSRSLTVKDIGKYLPDQTTELITGGASGVDACAEAYAREKGIPVRVFLPEYKRYRRAAPLLRNDLIIKNAEAVIAFWDGRSKGTKYVIDRCAAAGIPCRVIHL